MSLAQLAQPGILEAIPPHARYLSCQLCLGSQPQAVLQALARVVDGQGAVVCIGASLAQSHGSPVPGLSKFEEIQGALVKLPSIPVDLLIWLRGTDRGTLLTRSRDIEALLAPAFAIENITDAFNHDGGKDLTGYQDGTENPTGNEALTAALVPNGNSEPAGSSFLALQRWRHQFARFGAMASQEQDHAIGRERISNQELSDAPESAHVKHTAQESFGPEAFVLRRSMPWIQDNEGGLVFAAFGCSFDAFEAQLRRMSGAEDGVIDALFSFTEPQSGAYFWCPPMHNGRLDLRSLGL